MPIKDLIVLSDLHCGSTLALMPPEFKTLEGQTIKANPLQEWYWAAWLEMIEWAKVRTEGRPFAVVLNGDLIEGNHHRTTEIVSADVADHVEIAVQCLAPLIEHAEASFVIEGTECHTATREHSIARAIGSIGPNDRAGAWRKLDVTIGGVRSIFQHHISTSARTWTEATALGAALANEQLEAARAGEIPPQVLGSAHRHRPGFYQTSSGLSFVTGAWQGLTRHGRKVVASARCWPSAAHLHYDDGLPLFRQFDRVPPPSPAITL